MNKLDLFAYRRLDDFDGLFDRRSHDGKINRSGQIVQRFVNLSASDFSAFGIYRIDGP